MADIILMIVMFVTVFAGGIYPQSLRLTTKGIGGEIARFMTGLGLIFRKK